MSSSDAAAAAAQLALTLAAELPTDGQDPMDEGPPAGGGALPPPAPTAVRPTSAFVETNPPQGSSPHPIAFGLKHASPMYMAPISAAGVENGRKALLNSMAGHPGLSQVTTGLHLDFTPSGHESPHICPDLVAYLALSSRSLTPHHPPLPKLKKKE